MPDPKPRRGDPTAKQVEERAAAMAAHLKEGEAVRQKTARLKALRLEKEAADKLQAEAEPAPPSPRPRKRRAKGAVA